MAVSSLKLGSAAMAGAPRIALRRGLATAAADTITELPTGGALSNRQDPAQIRWGFFGPPGVGKGTFAAKVGPAFGVPTLSTGDLIRDEIKRGTPLGKKVVEYNDKGALVPDKLVTDMLLERLSRPDCTKGFILDGYPRTIQQARALDTVMPLKLVISFQLPNHILQRKLAGRRVCDQCGRSFNIEAIHEGDMDMPPLLPFPGCCNTCHDKPPLSQRRDDTEEVVRDRLRVYEELTFPLVEYYRQKGVLLPFHVKKGLGDLPRLLEVLQQAHKSGAPQSA